MPITVDVSQPEGNAYAIIGTVASVLRQCDRRDDIEPTRIRMMEGDYDNLLKVATEVTYGLVLFTNSNLDREHEFDEEEWETFVKEQPVLPDKNAYGDW